jgi:hypothetical protein
VKSLLERLVGSAPEQGGADVKSPEPSGALFVAQFAAERINQQINILSEQINRLENLG